MAKIGLNNFRYGILTEAQDGTPSYNGSHTPAKAVSCSVNITNNSAYLYADDMIAESDTSFQSGTVSIGIDDEDVNTMADLLGHTVENGEMVRNADDIASYVGFGRIVTKMVNGVYKYKVEFLYKVKFSEPNQDDTTKGENLAFTTSTLEGSVSTLANGKWSVTKTFDTKADASAYLDGILGGNLPTTADVEIVNGVDGETVNYEYVDVDDVAHTESVEYGTPADVTVKINSLVSVAFDGHEIVVDHDNTDLPIENTIEFESLTIVQFKATADGTIQLKGME